MLTWTVPGIKPVPQPRARVGKHGGYYPAGHPIKDYRAAIVSRLSQSGWDGQMIHEPITMSFVFVFPRAVSKCWKHQPMPDFWKRTSPDLSNLIKGVEDALCGVLYPDDNLIVGYHDTPKKIYGGAQWNENTKAFDRETGTLIDVRLAGDLT